MGPNGAHLGPTGPRWAPCWSHNLCYLGGVHLFSAPATASYDSRRVLCFTLVSLDLMNAIPRILQWLNFVSHIHMCMYMYVYVHVFCHYCECQFVTVSGYLCTSLAWNIITLGGFSTKSRILTFVEGPLLSPIDTLSTAILMGWCIKDVTPVHQQWSYIFLVLTHRYN